MRMCCYAIQMTDDLQEDEDRVLGDDKQDTERSVTSNRDPDDVPRSLLSPVPKVTNPIPGEDC